MIRKVLTCISCLILIAILAAMLGCSKDTGQIVAKVGDRPVTVEEMDRYINRMGIRFNSADQELEFRRSLLDTIINHNLLVIGAYEHNLDRHEEVLRAIEGEKIKFLLDALIEEEIVSKSTPSEAEIKDWYVKTGEELKVSHILVDSLATAEEVLKKLKEGQPFEELALEYSIDPSVKRNQGDLGYFTWGMMVDNFQEAAFKMQPGEVSAPVKTDYGYHIIKVVDRREVEHRPSYAEAKEFIRNSIMNRRQQKLVREYEQKMKKKYPIEIEKPTCDFVLNKLEFLYPETIMGRPRWRNNIDPQQLDMAEKDLVLGKYTGGQITIGEYLGNLRRVPEELRPDFDKYDSLAEIIFKMELMDIMAIEAKEQGIEDNENYKDKLIRFKEMAMADVMRNDTIPYDLEIDEGEVQEYYDTHLEEFTTPMRFDVYEIQVADSQQADRFATSVGSEDQFKRIASKETIRPGKKQISGKLGIITEQEYPELYEAAANQKQGPLAGPVKIGNKYSVLWISKRLPPIQQDFGAVKGQIIERLTRQKGNALFEEWIENMKKRVPVEIYEDVLVESVDEEKYEATDTTTVQTG